MLSEDKLQARKSVEAFFRNEARKQAQKNEKVPFESILLAEDKGRRLLITLPGSIGDVYLLTALLRSAKSQYPNHNIYVATSPEFFTVLKGNPYLGGCGHNGLIPYIPEMDNIHWCNGIGPHFGFFEITLLCHVPTQRIQMYQNNGNSNIAFDLKFPEPSKYSKLYLVEPPLPSALAQEIDNGITDIIHGGNEPVHN